MVSDISSRMGMEQYAQPEVEEMKRGVAPEAVLDAIEESERESEEERS